MKDKKIYENPTFEVLNFECGADVVTASGFGPGQELPDIELTTY